VSVARSEDETWVIGRRGPLRGTIGVPGDKSVSHRALLFNLLADRPARVRGLLQSEDVEATAAAVRQLGATIEGDPSDLVVTPPARLIEPADVVDCGNSGTSIRLLTGLLAAEPLFAVLTGDASLRSRPMKRVAEPLRAMGARIDGRDHGARAPVAVRGGDLRPFDADLTVASAQVKSAILLAGRKVGGRVREPSKSRDHSERMLRGMGAQLREDADGWLHLAPIDRLSALDVQVPGDVSASAFFLVAASIVAGSEVRIRGVGVNPTRTGVLDALRAMGADVEVHPVDADGAEPIADLVVRHAPLTGARIDGDVALRALDELPVLAVAAAFADGETVIADAEELRVKESDRIARMVAGLVACGVDAEERKDGMVIRGGRVPGGGRVNAFGDHRIAMSFSVLGLAADAEVTIDGAGSVRSSFPAFRAHLDALT
jgi:3-phosphoshikimate 1-carboxyvinyltransferase